MWSMLEQSLLVQQSSWTLHSLQAGEAAPKLPSRMTGQASFYLLPSAHVVVTPGAVLAVPG